MPDAIVSHSLNFHPHLANLHSPGSRPPTTGITKFSPFSTQVDPWGGLRSVGFPKPMDPSPNNQPPEIRANMTMTEVLTAFPGAQRALFAAYHIGGCSACSFQPTETLAEVCKRNEDIDIDEAITTILASYQSELSLSISPQDLQTALASDDPPELIDIRTREEHNAVSLPNARFFSADLQQEIFATWEKDAPIVVFDHTGNRGPDAAAYFVGHGFANTRALVGGIDAWSQEIDSTVARYKLEFDPA